MYANSVLLPNYWSGPFLAALACQVNGGIVIDANVYSEGANRALYLPVIFPCDATLCAMYAMGDNTTGNYDLGFYNHDGTLLASKGSTALAASLLTLTLPEIRVSAGLIYWAGVAASSGTSRFIRLNFASVLRMTQSGIGAEASAFPLPASMTPVTPAGAVVPLITFEVR